MVSRTLPHSLNTILNRFKHLRSLVIISALILVACKQPVNSYKSVIFTFGTEVDIEFISDSKQVADQVIDAITRDFLKMHILWHPWKKGPLARTNQLCALTGTFTSAPSVIPVIQEAQRLAIASEHLFNPAIGKLVDIWGFHKDDYEFNQPPTPQAIQQLLTANPRMTDISIKGVRMTCNNPALRIDLGGIAKGYAIEQVLKNITKKYGIKNIIINAGGDLKALGKKVNRPWRVGIRDPFAATRTAMAVIETNGEESVFTSGNYERYYKAQNKTWHHIIDPRTGYPARGSVSVTVIHPNATTADAAATALFVAGPKHWYRIAKKMGIKYVMLIDSKGQIYMNPAMQRRITFIQQPEVIKISPPL